MSLLDAEDEDRSIGFFPDDGLGIGFVPVERSFGGGAGGAGGAMWLCTCICSWILWCATVGSNCWWVDLTSISVKERDFIKNVYRLWNFSKTGKHISSACVNISNKPLALPLVGPSVWLPNEVLWTSTAILNRFYNMWWMLDIWTWLIQSLLQMRSITNKVFLFWNLKYDSLHESIFETKLIKEKINNYFKLYEQLGTLSMFNTISV